MYNISDKKRIVIKLGTSTLTHKTGRLNIRRMEKLVRVIADLHNSGKEVIIVSSGSIGLGVGKLGLRERPSDTPSKQAAAAVGQCELMYLYDNLFDNYGIIVAQMLLTKTIIENPERKKNVENTGNAFPTFSKIVHSSAETFWRSISFTYSLRKNIF